jgi:hypothetical protein
MKNTKSNRDQARKSKKKCSTKKTQDVPNAEVPNIKELLLNGPKFDLIIPKRTRWRRRPTIIFD